MKKFTFLLVSLFLTCLSASADISPDFTIDGIHYKITNPSNLEVAVTYKFYSSYFSKYENDYTGDIIIPETVKYGTRNFKVTSINNNAFYDCKYLNSVQIPQSVKFLGAASFSGCEKLVSIILPNTIDSLASSTFYKCTLLSELTLPDSLRKIEDYVFAGCESLQSIVLPDNVLSIGNYAFNGCNKLKTLSLPKNIKNIGKKIFSNADSIEKIICRAVIPPITDTDQGFSTLKYTMIDLIVPKGSLEAYKKADFWKNFPFMFEDEGENKCATPTVTFVDGKLSFACETAGAEFHYTIKCEDAISGSTTETTLPITGKYTVSVYATADGYGQSDTVTETIELKNGSGKKGDVTEDGKVDVADINAIVDIILGN